MIRKRFSFLYSDKFWCFLAAFILIGLSYLQVVINFQHAPSGVHYLGLADEYPIDSTWDFGLIREGYNGHLFPFLNFSSTLPDSTSLLKIEYTTVGLFARVTHLDPIAAFYVVRFVLSLVFLWIIYRIISFIFRRPLERVVAYVFVLFGASVTLSPATDFVKISAMDALVTQRLTLAAIHYQLGSLLSIVSLYFLSRFLDRPSRVRLFLAAAGTGALASLVNAPAMALVLSSLPLYFLIVVIRLWNPPKGKSHIVSQAQLLFSYAVITSLPVFYVRYVTTTVWGPYDFNFSEQLNPFHLTLWQYILAMGSTYLLSLFSIPRIVKNGKTLLLLLVGWIVMHPIGEYVIPGMLHINNIRYFFTPYFVGFGILATVGVWEIVSFSQKYIRKIPANVIVGCFVLVVLGSSYETFSASFTRAELCFCDVPTSTFGYPQQDLVSVLTWLGTHSSENEIVLSGFYAGNLIPVFSGNRVYTSWWQRLMEPAGLYDVRMSMESFYLGKMTDDEAAMFVHTNNIRWVLYSPTEHINPAFQTLPYSFLTLARQTGDTQLYKVR